MSYQFGIFLSELHGRLSTSRRKVQVDLQHQDLELAIEAQSECELHTGLGFGDELHRYCHSSDHLAPAAVGHSYQMGSGLGFAD